MENKAFLPVVLGLTAALGFGYYISQNVESNSEHYACSHGPAMHTENNATEDVKPVVPATEPVVVKEVVESIVEPVVVKEVTEPALPETTAEAVRLITTTEEFDKLVKESKKPIVVKAFAEWCGPCKGMAPHFEKVAKEFKDSVVCVEIDVDKAQDLSTKLEISAMPTLVFYKNGNEVSRKQGGLNKEQLRAEFNNLIEQK